MVDSSWVTVGVPHLLIKINTAKKPIIFDVMVLKLCIARTETFGWVFLLKIKLLEGVVGFKKGHEGTKTQRQTNSIRDSKAFPGAFVSLWQKNLSIQKK
jgi:hypothetical protein